MASELLELPRSHNRRRARSNCRRRRRGRSSWRLALTLVFAGLVTSASVSILGAIFAVAGCVGWFRDVLPTKSMNPCQWWRKCRLSATRRPQVARVEWMTEELHRARLPLEIYPISAGVKGGLAGSVAMAVLAVLYGIISGHGMWYPINLLSAGFFPAA